MKQRWWSLAALAATAAQHAPTPTIVPPRLPDRPPARTDAIRRAAIRPIAPRKVILVGDSTTQVGSGWGGEFCARHVTSTIACVNLARGGRGTFDYRAEGGWDVALAEMRVPGYRSVHVLIQFGHNDQPGKPGRSTDLRTEYPENLRRYVREARAAGAMPVLVTPLTRRTFKNGSLQDDLAAWADAVRAVARELDAPLIDLHARSVARVQAMGPRAALDLAQVPPPPELVAAAATGTTIAAPRPAASAEPLERPRTRAAPAFDYTHLGPAGAALFAREVATALAEAVPTLAPDLLR